ncbi:MAG: HlyD family efflux transporter periplasmic adaptor subunit, partial [Pseudomonadota bacterium]
YFVFGILGGSVWSRIDTIDVQHGRIDVPERVLSAADTGLVVASPVAPGTRVSAGDILVEIRDYKRDADVERARLEVARAEAAHHEVLTAVLDLERAMAPETALKLRMAKAALHHMTFFRTTSFEDVRLQWADLRRVDPEAAKSLDPASLTLDRLYRLLSVRETELTSARDVLYQTAHDANALSLRAPTDGVVREVVATPGSAVRGGASLVVMETDAAPNAVGWASERLAETLYVGMPATIGYNLGGEKISATGEIFDLTAGEDPTRPGEFGIIVTVATERFDNARTRRILRSGAPVNLAAEKQLAGRAIASADRILQSAIARRDAVFAFLRRRPQAETMASDTR